MKKIMFCVSKVILLFSIVLSMSYIVSCKQEGSTGSSETSGNEVTLTVNKDPFITNIEHDKITVTKNVDIGLSDLKAKIGNIEVMGMSCLKYVRVIVRMER